MNEGEFADVDARSSSAYHVLSNRPIIVAQYCKSYIADGNRISDPFMTFVPHVNQWLGAYSLSTFAGFTSLDGFEHYVNMYVFYPDMPLVRLDGESIPTSVFTRNWTDFADSPYSVATIKLSPGYHVIGIEGVNTTLGGIIYGFKFQESLGNPLGMAMQGGSTSCVRLKMVAGDGFDNDCDGLEDEEVYNGEDDDLDGLIDEDLEIEPTTQDVVTTVRDLSSTTKQMVTTARDLSSTSKEVVTTARDPSSTTQEVVTTARDPSSTTHEVVTTVRDPSSTLFTTDKYLTPPTTTFDNIGVGLTTSIETTNDIFETTNDLIWMYTSTLNPNLNKQFITNTVTMSPLKSNVETTIGGDGKNNEGQTTVQDNNDNSNGKGGELSTVMGDKYVNEYTTIYSETTTVIDPDLEDDLVQYSSSSATRGITSPSIVEITTSDSDVTSLSWYMWYLLYGQKSTEVDPQLVSSTTDTDSLSTNQNGEHTIQITSSIRTLAPTLQNNIEQTTEDSNANAQFDYTTEHNLLYQSTSALTTLDDNSGNNNLWETSTTDFGQDTTVQPEYTTTIYNNGLNAIMKSTENVVGVLSTVGESTIDPRNEHLDWTTLDHIVTTESDLKDKTTWMRQTSYIDVSHNGGDVNGITGNTVVNDGGVWDDQSTIDIVRNGKAITTLDPLGENGNNMGTTLDPSNRLDDWQSTDTYDSTATTDVMWNSNSSMLVNSSVSDNSTGLEHGNYSEWNSSWVNVTLEYTDYLEMGSKPEDGGMGIETLLMIIIPMVIVFGIPLCICCKLILCAGVSRCKRKKPQQEQQQKPKGYMKQKVKPHTFATPEYERAQFVMNTILVHDDKTQVNDSCHDKEWKQQGNISEDYETKQNVVNEQVNPETSHEATDANYCGSVVDDQDQFMPHDEKPKEELSINRDITTRWAYFS